MNYYSAIDSNKRKSLLVMIGFVAFISAAVYFMVRGFNLNPSFVPLALIASGAMSFVSYYFSDRVILTMSGARPATREEFFDFYTVTENLCLAAKTPLPRLYVIDDSAMNAFATGRDPAHAVICATTGILQRLDRSELEGVVAHELAHIRNYDIRLMSIVTILVGFVVLLSDWLLHMSFWGGNRRSEENREGGQLQAIFFILGMVFALLSPIAAQLIQLAISRRREYLADASGAALTKYPEGLARALEKLSRDQEPLEAANKATAHLYIHSPFYSDTPHSNFSGKGVGWFSNLFATHPPIEDRIAKLRNT